MRGQSRLPLYLGLAMVAGAVGFGVAAWAPESAQARKAALVGVAEMVASGLVGLWLKRWALAFSMGRALGVVGVIFMLRLMLVSVGLVLVVRAGWSGTAFAVGFFGEYFVLQWIEVTYVVAESKRRDPGGV